MQFRYTMRISIIYYYLQQGTSKNQESYTYRSLQKNALRRQRV
jgi:hypothetical protein